MNLFSPTSPWNTPVTNATVDPNSAAMVAAVLADNKAAAAWFNTTTIVEVPAGQPTLPVARPGAPTALVQAWSAVPMYAPTLPADTEHDLAIYQPSTDTMWEFFELSQPTATTWQAEWGGQMQHVSANQGVYGPDAYPGANVNWGVRASGFPVAAGVITFDDIIAGVINHALVAVVPLARKGVFSSPAVRCDGRSTDPNSLPEGARLRLDPALDLSTLTMPALTRMIAVAAQTYGIIVGDQSNHAMGLYLQDPNGDAWAKNVLSVMYGKLNSGQLLAAFPWAHLQVLTLDLHPMP